MPRVSIPDSNKSFEVNEGEILYDSLFDRGFALPHGCLSGSCGACKVEVLEGSENLMKPGAIESDTLKSIQEEFDLSHGPDFLKSKQIRLSCRAKVLGNVSIKSFK